MLSKGGPDLQLLLNGCVSPLHSLSLRLGSCAEGALPPKRLIFQGLQILLEPIKFRLTLSSIPTL